MPSTQDTPETGTNSPKSGDISVTQITEKTGPDTEQQQQTTTTVVLGLPEEPFCVFTRRQKLCIILLASTAGTFSTLCSYVYYPAINAVADDLDVSVSLVNLTITSYLLVAAVAPAFMGDMADQSGRRPIYMLMFTLFISANIGIALQRSYPALLVLRMLQSAGSSGLIAVAYGVIADITTRGERGGYCAVFDILLQAALSIGPVSGGAITQYLGWRWIFWFLTILTSSYLVLMLLFFPETQRHIVGNGSVKPRGVYWSLFTLFQHQQQYRRGGAAPQEEGNPTTTTATTTCDVGEKPKRHYPNPFACLPILRDKASLIAILIYSITYAVKMTLQASLGAQCVEIYQLDYLDGGLIYIPSGIAGAVAAYLTGKFLDRTYKLSVEEYARDGIQQSPNSNTPDFPLEKVRLKGIYFMITSSAVGIVGYGLVLMTKTHIAAMLVMQFLTGLTTAGIYSMSATLLADLNREASATAQGACSLIRCLAAGAAIAAMEPVADAAGEGWCFAVYAILMLVEAVLVWIILKHGVRWRKEKLARSAMLASS